MIEVLKFGETALQNDLTIAKVIEIIKKHQENKLIVVVSAMKNGPYATKTLSTLANNLTIDEASRIVSCGETISSVILSSRLKNANLKAISLSCHQIGLKTRKKRLVAINQARIKKLFETYDILIIPGFQGINEQGEIRILDPGDSDYTAIYLAKRLKLDRVYLYSEAGGIYTGDPEFIDHPKLLSHINYFQVLDLVKYQSGIIAFKALAEANKIDQFKIMLRSYSNEKIGTLINHDDLNVRTMAIDFVYHLIRFETVIDNQDRKYFHDHFGKDYFIKKENLSKLKTPYLIMGNYTKIHFVGCGLNKDEIYRNFLDRFAIVSQNETASYYINERTQHQDINLLHDIIVRSD